MDMRTKIAYIERDIRNISRADDTDSAVRNAALDRVIEIVEAERKEMMERVAKKAEALGG